MKLNDGDILPFSDCLYKAKCRVCDDKLEWRDEFDGDGISYYSECCNYHYSMRPNTILIEIHDIGDKL